MTSRLIPSFAIVALPFAWGLACTSTVTSAGPTNEAVDTGDSGPIAEEGDDAGSGAEASLQSDAVAADGAPHDVPSTFDVRHLQGLVFWVDASSLATGTTDVRSWPDGSPAHNDLASTSAGAPLYAPAAVNGHPAVHFGNAKPNTTLVSASRAALVLGQSDFLVGCVVRPEYAPLRSVSLVNLAADVASLSLYLEPVGRTAEFSAKTSSQGYWVTGQAGLDDGKPHMVLAHRYASGQTVDLRVDGVVEGTRGDGYRFDGTGSNATISLGEKLEGDVAEVVIVKGTVSAADVSALEASWKKKYGL